MRKSDFCLCQNKGADQLRSNCEADQRLCFRYSDGTISLLPKSELSSFNLPSMRVQLGLCQTWSETQKTGFSLRGSFKLAKENIIHEKCAYDQAF